MNDILNKKIEDLEMSIRVTGSLNMHGIKTVGDITKMTESSLKRLPNIGRLSVNEIKHTLKDLGLELGMHSKPQKEPPEKTLINDLKLSSNGWTIDAEIMLQALKRKVSISEIPTCFLGQPGGRKSFVGYKAIIEFVIFIIKQRVFGIK